ncbi:MAG: 2Fe-2S iron-sulfur cluster-binding protein [Xanthobacteraceae bacterium]
MTPIALTVNGRKVAALVEPRTHLADFLREHCRLTGTHLGCEHGVCGACTVLIEGEPARSCIAYAVACDGLAIETIEGFDGDPIMLELREAFSREHALQCGFCTSGMLIAARDIVRRLPGADEQRIRVELSGNLCRCTGYLGIVNAVASVVEARGSTLVAAGVGAEAAPSARLATFVPSSIEAGVTPPPASATPALDQPRQGWTRFEESFVIVGPPATVWQVFADVPTIAACLPGAELTEHDAQTAKGKMAVKLGPIRAAFGGSAVIERDDRTLRGVIRGAGSDRGTGSRTKGEVVYRLAPEGEGDRTRISLVVEYSLQGALAQFSRSSLAQDLGRRLVADFAANLNARLGGGAATGKPSAPLGVGRLLWSWLGDRLRRLFRR